MCSMYPFKFEHIVRAGLTEIDICPFNFEWLHTHTPTHAIVQITHMAGGEGGTFFCFS